MFADTYCRKSKNVFLLWPENDRLHDIVKSKLAFDTAFVPGNKYYGSTECHSPAPWDDDDVAPCCSCCCDGTGAGGWALRFGITGFPFRPLLLPSSWSLKKRHWGMWICHGLLLNKLRTRKCHYSHPWGILDFCLFINSSE